MKKQLLFLLSVVFCLSSTHPIFGQWSQTQLSQARGQMGTASLGAKAYFGGGSMAAGQTTRVDIYDATTGTVTNKNLSVGRAFPAVAGIGNKVLFAGGVFWDALTHYTKVDILDTLTLQFTTANLSVARMYAQAATVGNQVLIAGGFKIADIAPFTFTVFDVVDIYNNTSGTWSTKTLSQARGAMAVAVAGNIAVFAGGQLSTTSASDRVDIYNGNTNTWTTATLSQARAYCAATAVGKKILIAGGVTSSNVSTDRVDIYDTETGVWTTSNLSEARSFTTQGATLCGKAYFAGGGTASLSFFGYSDQTNRVDIYDPTTNTWSTDNLLAPLINHSVVSVKNKLLIAGGVNFTTGFNKKLEIYSCTGTSGIGELETNTLDIQLSPNPASEMLTIMIPSVTEKTFQVQVYDFSGKLITHFEMAANIDYTINVADWAVGGYFVKVFGGQMMRVQKVIKL